EARGIAAVAGAIRAQRLAVGKRVLAAGIALAVGGGGAVDTAAVKHFRDARRAKRLAHLHRRRAAARGDRKILAVATAHAKGRTRACHARRGHRRLLLEAERIGEETCLWKGLAR